MPARIKLSKRHKYNAIRVTLPTGERFDSKHEAACWLALVARQERGEIRNLERQVRIPLSARGGEVVGRLVVDFVFEEKQGNRWKRVVADAKGMATQLWLWKARHYVAEYGEEIRKL